MLKILAHIVSVLGLTKPGLCSLGNELKNVPAEVSAFKLNGLF